MPTGRCGDYRLAHKSTSSLTHNPTTNWQISLSRAAMKNREIKAVKAKFDELLRSPLSRFPTSRRQFKETDKRGVYVIYSPRGEVLHVGGTPRGQKGIRQRLANHFHGQSSFTHKSKYLWRHGGRTLKARYTFVREHCRYRCLAI